ncbi:PREDICTED: phosphoglycerate mutase-like protein AT74H [Ipomoea nil]|uniref:phosphoglycerate mutase-like protein AT74H n=1 Tax=Ipomoea nil TaxID=35883 RepID=UPI000900D88A|nr:PREDICTED: phosphoglycerate mutase-like protein AT74H [Ipomoea nil]
MMRSNGKHENGRVKSEDRIGSRKWVPKRIILVRHGESFANADVKVFSTTPNHMIKLSPKGIAQARNCGHLIKQLVSQEDDEDWKVFFYVSPTARTVESLREMGLAFPKRRVVGVKEEHALREQHFGNYNDPPAIYRIKDERTTYGRFFYRVPGGEAGCEVYDRISSFVEGLKRDIDANKFGRGVDDDDDPAIPSESSLNLVIVSHGFTARVFLMKWFNWTVEQFEKLNRMKSSEFQVLQLGKGGGEYSLAIHHDDAKLMEWGLSAEMIEDQKRRAAGGELEHKYCQWDTHRFLHLFRDSSDSEDDDDEQNARS